MYKLNSEDLNFLLAAVEVGDCDLIILRAKIFGYLGIKTDFEVIKTTLYFIMFLLKYLTKTSYKSCI